MADTGIPKDTTAATGGEGKPKTSSRKRKADELSDEETDETPPHLPAPVWGRVLDFVPYAEVRSALLVAKLIAVEAVQYVQALNIMRGCEMYIPAARRFANVEEVNILCLLERTGEEDEDGDDMFSVSLDVSNRTVPFLGCFAKLARAFIGGLNSDGYSVTHDYHSVEHDDHVFRRLLSAYIGAIKTGSLSEKMTLVGMDVTLLRRSSCGVSSSNCQWCKDILSCFPINDLLPFLVNHSHVFCQNEQEQWGVVRRRPGVGKGFSEVSAGVLCDFVGNMLFPKTVAMQFRAAAVEHLPEKWRLAALLEELHVCSISQSDFQKLDELIEKGFDPKHVTREEALGYWMYLLGADISDYYDTEGWDDETLGMFFTWTRTTVESLAARGFPVDCNCVPVIDDKYWEQAH